MRTLLIQPGARHGYALARFLHKEGALQRLYTDFAVAEHSAGHLMLRAAGFFSSNARSLSRRVAPDIPASSVRGLSPRALVAKMRTPDAPERWRFKTRDLEEADVIYSQYYAGGPQIDELVANGARFVSDVFIMPSAHKVVNQEAIKFPAWNEACFSEEMAALFDAVSTAMIERSDGLFCPSQSVIDDVGAYSPAARAKCRLVRYGSSFYFDRPNVPQPKRVLFAGSIQLRKGPQYLALAAAQIARIDPEVRFVFAGAATASAAAQLRAANIELLGHLPREKMRAEFLRADVLAFPSLAEGSAGVVLEAMSAGVPVVATREAGVDFRNEESGLLVPPRDVDALSEAILTIVGDRKRRESMARSARGEFRAYDERAWERAFLDALREFSRDG